MTEENIKQAEEWDPDEAMEQMSAKRLKMPVTFLRNQVEEAGMMMEVQDPPEKVVERTKPKIVHRPKNKNALF